MTWHDLEVDAGGVRLHVRRFDPGDTAAQSLVLLHGLGASGAVWQSFARRLAPQWAAIAPDLRGHGSSGHPPSAYQPADYAQDLAALLSTLGIERAPVVGHSLGALVALALAAQAPDHVTALALLDPPLDRDRTNLDVAEVYRLRHEPGDALERYLAEGSSVLIARAMAPIFRQAADGVYEAYLNGARGASWAWDLAPTLAMPVLVVQADPALGAVLGDEAAEAFVARLPRGKLVRLPGASHAVHATKPAETAQAVLEFLGAPPPSPQRPVVSS